MVVAVPNPALAFFAELGILSLGGGREVGGVGVEEGGQAAGVGEGDQQDEVEGQRAQHEDHEVGLVEVAEELGQQQEQLSGMAKVQPEHVALWHRTIKIKPNNLAQAT